MQQFIDSILVSSASGMRPLGNASVSVYVGGTTNLAVIYSDNGSTQKENPFFSGPDGGISFYAADGRYDIRIVHPLHPEQWIRDVLLMDVINDGFVRESDLGSLAYQSALGVTDSESIHLSGDGSDENPVTASVVLSDEPENLIEITEDGLYADDQAVRNDLASTDPGKGAELVGFKQFGTGAVARTLADKARDDINRNDWVSLADAITAAHSIGRSVKVFQDTTVRVPTDCPNLQIALDTVVCAREGIKITILIESGHRLDSGVFLVGGNYSQYVIMAEDAIVYLDDDWVPGTSLMFGINCFLPVWGVFVDCQGKDVGTVYNPVGSDACSAFVAASGSQLIGLSGAGATNGAANNSGLLAIQGSRVVWPDLILTHFGVDGVWITHQSEAYIPRAVVTHSGRYGLYASRVSMVYAAGIDASHSAMVGVIARRSRISVFPDSTSVPPPKFNNCGIGIQALRESVISAAARSGVRCQFFNISGNAIEAADGSLVDARGAEIDEIGGNAVVAYADGHVIVNEATISEITGHVLVAGDSATRGFISAANATAATIGVSGVVAQNGSSVSVYGSSFLGAVEYGILCDTGSSVSAADVNLSGAGIAGLWATNGGKISAPNANVSSCGHGAVAFRGGEIIIPNANAKNCLTRGLRAYQGGRIVAIGADARTVDGTDSPNDVVVSLGGQIMLHNGSGGTTQPINTWDTNGFVGR